ncbi:molybdenum cofactor guanylyltransferase [Nannocystaceae bacterium ST9]
MAGRLGGLVLAGGASRRMGRDKAWLELEGRPLLLHVIDRLAPVCERIVVVAAPGQNLPDLPAGVARVDDPPALHGRGPLIGVSVGLEALARAGVELAYLSGCDAAALSDEHVRFMLERLAAAPEADALVPRDAQGLHPLASALRVEPAWARARAMVGDDRRRLFEWVEPWPTIDADELPDPSVLAPCNEPAQWLALLAQLKPRLRSRP